MQSTDRFLLTGAGFTHNFGGPLARELWAMIFSHPRLQKVPTLRELFLQNFDFEDVYYSVMEGSYPPAVKQALGLVVSEAYDAIDDAVRDFKSGGHSPFPVNIYGVQELIAAFSGTRKYPGFFFTLDQDLFVERHYYNGPRLQLPGMQTRQNWFSGNARKPLERQDYCQAPTEPELAVAKVSLLHGNEFYYLKLHGSCNWKSSSSPQHMVIGRGKEQQIKLEPLLAWYLELFKIVLSKDESKLLVIGYGFADTHVNNVIADAVVNTGLRLYVVSPQSPSAFQASIQKNPRGDEIWRGLGGYYQYTLAQLFPADKSETAAWRTVKRQFFEDRLTWSII